MEYINKILQGNALQILRSMPDGIADMCVTSPPYFGLRDYGTEGEIWDGEPDCKHKWGKEFKKKVCGNKDYPDTAAQAGNRHSQKILETKNVISQGNICENCGAWKGSLGLEPTPELYIKHLTDIFREVRRVLKPTGTLWLNLGDSYAGSGGVDGMPEDHVSISGVNRQKYAKNNPNKKVAGLKNKDLIGIPWMAAFSLRNDGWWLRADIIWAKKNSMPESVLDRVTRSHEYIFHMAKSKKYYYDADAIAEPITAYSRMYSYNNPDNRKDTGKDAGKVHKGLTPDTQNAYYEKMRQGLITTKNKRSVWHIATKSFHEAHFATFNEDLIRPCILAGASEKGCCSKCGSPYVRMVDKERKETENYKLQDLRQTSAGSNNTDSKGKVPSYMPPVKTTITWAPTCSCKKAEVVPSIVLDIFMGSGTTAVVAMENKRNFIGIELNAEYIKMAEKRISPQLHTKRALEEFFS